MNHPMTPNEVRAARAAYGLTARDLAHILDVNERTVRRWETGQTHPNGAVAAEIRALDNTIDNMARAISTGAAPPATAPAGMIRVAQWRAHQHHGTRIP